MVVAAVVLAVVLFGDIGGDKLVLRVYVELPEERLSFVRRSGFWGRRRL